MDSDISRVRRDMVLLLGVAAGVGLGLLGLVIPFIFRGSWSVFRRTLVSYLIFIPLYLAGLLIYVHHILNPVAELADVQRSAQAIQPELMQRTRTLAFTAPVRFLYLPVIFAFVLSLVINAVGGIFVPGFSFGRQFPLTIAITLITTWVSLLASVFSRRILAPVLSFTSGLAEDDGVRFNIRTRYMLTTFLLAFVAIAFIGVLGYNMVGHVALQNLQDKYRLLAKGIRGDLGASLDDQTLLAYIESLALEDGVAFVINGDGTFLTSPPLDHQEDLALIGETLSLQTTTTSTGMQEGVWSVEALNGEILLLALDRPGVDWWLGFFYRGRPLMLPDVRESAVIIVVFVLLTFALVFVINHYVADDLTQDLTGITARVQELSVGQGNGFEKLRMTSLDEVGDLVLAFNNLLWQVQSQQLQVEREQIELRALLEISRNISYILDTDQLLQEIVASVDGAFGYRNMVIFLLDDAMETLYIAACSDVLYDDLHRHQFPVDEQTLVGRVALHGQALLSHDGDHGKSCFPHRSYVRSELAVPMIVSGRIVGVFNVGSETPGAFLDQDRRIVTAIANQAAVALHNAQLYKEVKEQRRSVQDQARELAETTARLTKEKGRLKGILYNIADGLMVTDNKHRVALVNPAFERMFNRSAATLIGRPIIQVIQEEPLLQLVSSALKNQVSAFSTEIPMPDGRTFKASSAAIRDEPHDLGVVTVIHDVTHEKEVDRMKTEFISTVSHELRTPLTSILGFAKLVNKVFERDLMPTISGQDEALQRVADNLGIIVVEGERLTSLINDVLDISKMESGKAEWNDQPFDLTRVVREVVADMRDTAHEKGIALAVDVPYDLPVLCADPYRVRQLIVNLVDNALKFTKQGQVTVSVCLLRDAKALQGVDPLVEAACLLTGEDANAGEDQEATGVVLVSVADTGIGIPEEAIPNLFQRFQQIVTDPLTNKPKGTGLGLAICREIVMHYGGRLWAESEVGKGSTFYFALPLNAVQAEAGTTPMISEIKRPVQSALHAAQGVAPLVMVVDDEDHIRSLLRQELEAAGYRVLEATNGTEAISLARHHVPAPSLVVLDVMMPNLSGFDVTRILKSDPVTASIPILILSIIEDREHGFALGADDYLIKPVDTETLLTAISELLDQTASDASATMVTGWDPSTLEFVTSALRDHGFEVVEACEPDSILTPAQTITPDLLVMDEALSDWDDTEVVKALRFQNASRTTTIIVLFSSPFSVVSSERNARTEHDQDLKVDGPYAA